MPSLFLIGGYRVFFWSNEGNEAIHVHVRKGAPSSRSTKLWLTRQGGCIVASNGAHIPQSTLNDLMDIIAAQFDYICLKWKEFYVVGEIHFYC